MLESIPRASIAKLPFGSSSGLTPTVRAGEVTIIGSWGAAVLWAAIVAAAEAGKRWLRRRALRRL